MQILDFSTILKASLKLNSGCLSTLRSSTQEYYSYRLHITSGFNFTRNKHCIMVSVTFRNQHIYIYL